MKDDTISRQAAISLPPKPREDRYFQTQNLDDAYDYGWRDLQRCIEKLPPAQPEQRWIPCSEKIPKKTGYYICTCHDGACYRTSVLKWSTGWVLTGARSYWKVIAWMPMPEPYKERRSDG